MSVLVLSAIVSCAIVVVAVVVSRRASKRKVLAEHSVTAEELHRAMDAGETVLLLDVRQPLDLLAYSQMIPGAARIAPKDVIAHPEQVPLDRDVVFYCTCPSDKTSWEVLKKAQSFGRTRLKVLTGGLDEWKAKGFAVEPYRAAFHLDTAT